MNGTRDNSTRIEEILFDALTGIDDARARDEFLDQTCRGNPALRARLEELISLRDDAEKFFNTRHDTPLQPPAADPAPTAAEPDEGLGTRIGRYRLVERLGEGGCGAVYLAEQLEPVRRRVALKIIRVGMGTAQIIERFELERQTLAVMDHPNIARVLDAGSTASGRPFFVMELVEGQRITDFCDQHRLDLPARLRLFIPVCLAIQHAHLKGIIHCDIKPSNVMVTLHDGVAVPKVIDFGIAKATEADPTLFSHAASPLLIGTPAYMSPEQVDGHGLDIDSRSDIYSLGALLHELLAGKPPRDPETFRHATPEQIRERLRTLPVPPPSERLQACPPAEQEAIATARHTEMPRLPRLLRGDLDAIVMKAMKPDRQDRYVTANGLAADVSRHLAHEPVEAVAAGGRRYRLGKLVRRNRLVFAAGGLVALALCAGLGTSTWLFIREARAREEQVRLRYAAEIARANEVGLREKAQTREAVAHAAVLISHGGVQQADQLLAAVPLDDVPVSLESAEAFRAAGDWLLWEGRWEDAAQRYAAMAQAMTKADQADMEWISLRTMAAAAATCYSGDPALYERLRVMASERFASTVSATIASEVVRCCFMKPPPSELLARLDPMVKLLERVLPWDKPNAPGEAMESWQMLSLSLAKYRMDDFQQARNWARRCLSHPNRNPACTATAHVMLAMAAGRSGQDEEARAQLAEARPAITSFFTKPFSMGGPKEGWWFDWMIARILLKEADAMKDR
ncbi:serine/threonine-protein kinase [Luteolibacter sp. LG18]|uniref:serine/threonine-protein kinase n=1 Tax=Luteolibacter sp. LG18 TaxID=2819286 RepID=UPI002B290F94|nr:hypothetical protein llg_30930 [Luteolibacter sp. LG18]